VTCPDVENIRVQFFSLEEATYVKECFDLVNMGMKLQFSEFNISSQQQQQPDISYTVIQRDIYRRRWDGTFTVPYATDPSWFNRWFPLQTEIGRDCYF
jgi:hypothetical protein